MTKLKSLLKLLQVEGRNLMWEHKTAELHPHIWSHGPQTVAAGGGQHFSSCQPRRFVLRESVALHLALLLCARQVVRSKNGGHRQGGGAEKVVENTGSPFSCQSQHADPIIGQQVLESSQHSRQYLRTDAMTAEHHGNDCAWAFYSFIHASLNNC